MGELFFRVLKETLMTMTGVFIDYVKGVENIPLKNNFIIVSNHQKLIDPLLIYYSLVEVRNDVVYFISSTKWFNEDRCRSMFNLIPHTENCYVEAKEKILDNEIVGIFPEGYLDNNQKHIKSGAVLLSTQTKVPILPIGLTCSYFPFSGKINIGELIYFHNYDISVEEKNKMLMEIIYKLKRR